MTKNGHSNGAINGAAKETEAQTTPAPQAANSASGEQKLDPAILEKIAAVRSKVNETFGKVALAMMATPRYRHLSIGDLSHLLLDPLIRDRVAIAQPATPGPEDGGLAGIAIWASGPKMSMHVYVSRSSPAFSRFD